MPLMNCWLVLCCLIAASAQVLFTIPSTAPKAAQTVDPALISLSIEFFAFPAYAALKTTNNCLANLHNLRGVAPAVRIGGTTQDRATYDPKSQNAVNYVVASPVDAPTSLTYGPSFFTLASTLPGDVTIGLNRQLNNQTNTRIAATQAVKTVKKLLAIELGNEPEFYAASSPIIPAGATWSPALDATSQNQWFTAFGPQLGSSFQAAVYLQEPTWGTAELIPKLTTGTQYVKTFSGHSYPQSACGGAATNLTNLMSHSSIVQYSSRFANEAAAAHSVGKRYFLGETNSATCGGGGISPTFGAALWIVDVVMQSALQGVERLYFHQGTIAACPYCWWNDTNVNAPYYGAAFLSKALGTDTSFISQLDSGNTTLAVYALYSAERTPIRVLVVNSQLYDGQGTRPSSVVELSGLPSNSSNLAAMRLAAPSALSQTATGGSVTIGGAAYNGDCIASTSSTFETLPVQGNAVVTIHASEALYVIL